MNLDDIPRRAYTPATNSLSSQIPVNTSELEFDVQCSSEQIRLVVQRLARTRTLLHANLDERNQRHNIGGTTANSGSKYSPRSWLQRIQDFPGASLFISAAKFWWSKHPLHTLTSEIGKASTAVIEPIAKRHPVVLVSSAMLVGAALVWLRPWRWVGKPTLYVGIVSQIAAALAAQMSINKTGLSDKPK
jgi:hypothetical protein